MTSAILQKLQRTTIKAFLEDSSRLWRDTHLHEPKNIVVLYNEHNIEAALRIFHKYGILSAPVSDVERVIVGMVDMLDIATYIMQVVTHLQQPDQEHPITTTTATPNIVDFDYYVHNPELLTRKAHTAFATSVLQVVGISRADPFCPVYCDGTLYQLMEVFERGVHRCVVLDADSDSAPSPITTTVESGSEDEATIARNSRVVAVISQSAVLQYVAHNLHLVSTVCLHKKISELVSVSGSVISMSSKAAAIHAFYLIHFHKVNCVAIVDSEQNLVGDVNTDDIRGMRPDNVADLLLNVMTFITKVEHRRNPITGEMSGVSVCRESDTFECVLLKMALLKTHHLWVLADVPTTTTTAVANNNNNRVVGVVTLTDLIRGLLLSI